MSFLILVAITLVSTCLVFKLHKKKPTNKHLPKGSLGYPLIGETFSFLQAQKKDQGPEWINERVKKYGPVFKTSLMGAPTVVIIGQSGNKFILGSDEDVLIAKQPKTLSTIAGKYNIFELTGSRYQLIKGALLTFMKPTSLQSNIKQIDDLITGLFLKSTKKTNIIPTVDFMKRVTFNIASSVLFGIQNELLIDEFCHDFAIAFKALWSLPLNIPGFTYWHGMRARSRIINRLMPIIKMKKEHLVEGRLTPTSDILTSLIAVKLVNEDVINEEMIIDNFITMMIAGHDTSAILMSLMVWKMSKDSKIHSNIFEEQMEILRDIETREDHNLTWGDIQRMKYTWRVAQELMRIIPPVFGSFRKVVNDTTFGGFDIPKGWQVFWSAYNTHMNNDIFENPKEFDPSRFENNLSKPIPPYMYIPFGGGQHSCLGNEFARVETLVTMHKLVTMYEWSLIHSDEVITRQPMPYPSMGLPIKVIPRVK
ncbi:taxadiene 5-alpha hydroxylase-like [Bidens hawaiensis]|uniref:taxadiene 5-alpha hydroxylase-like n=1 Tax=Bidens hawaiensis TaxID=980011 RepID=UPI00404AFB37